MGMRITLVMSDADLCKAIKCTQAQVDYYRQYIKGQDYGVYMQVLDLIKEKRGNAGFERAKFVFQMIELIEDIGFAPSSSARGVLEAAGQWQVHHTVTDKSVIADFMLSMPWFPVGVLPEEIHIN